MVNDRGESIIAVTSVFLGISLVAVSLRCYVRLRIVKAFGWDDRIMVLAMVCPNYPYVSRRILTVKVAEYSILALRYYRCDLRYWAKAVVFYDEAE